MGLHRARPAKNTHNQIIDAICGAVIEACRSSKSRKFSVDITKLPETAHGYSAYDLERVDARLKFYGVKVETMTMENHTFHFFKL